MPCLCASYLLFCGLLARTREHVHHIGDVNRPCAGTAIIDDHPRYVIAEHASRCATHSFGRHSATPRSAVPFSDLAGPRRSRRRPGPRCRLPHPAGCPPLSDLPNRRGDFSLRPDRAWATGIPDTIVRAPHVVGDRPPINAESGVRHAAALWPARRKPASCRPAIFGDRRCQCGLFQVSTIAVALCFPRQARRHSAVRGADAGGVNGGPAILRFACNALRSPPSPFSSGGRRCATVSRAACGRIVESGFTRRRSYAACRSRLIFLRRPALRQAGQSSGELALAAVTSTSLIPLPTRLTAMTTVVERLCGDR